MVFRKRSRVPGCGHWIAIVALVLPVAGIHADDWPQWRGPERDGVWRETGIVKELPEALSVKWRTPIGHGYAGPAVVGDRVYVMDRMLDDGARNPLNPFDRTAVGGVERVLCLNGDTGEIVWEHKYPCEYAISYPSGPRVTPSIVDGKVYTVGAMGDFWCLDAQSGKVLWSKDYKKEYKTEINTWGMAAHPLVHDGKVILLVAGEAGVVALDKESGEEVWRRPMPAATDPGYCPPILVDAGGAKQLIIWTPVAVSSLNPTTGDVYWTHDRRTLSGLSISQPIFDPARRLLMMTSFYDGSFAMTLSESEPKADVAWVRGGKSETKTDALHAIMCTPYLEGDWIYGVCSYGQLRCLKADTGERVWETFDATGNGRWWNAFLIRHEDKTVIANEQGDLIFAKLTPEGYRELSRSHLIEPTGKAGRREIVWSHPAFANRSVYARNDQEILRADLAQ